MKHSPDRESIELGDVVRLIRMQPKPKKNIAYYGIVVDETIANNHYGNAMPVPEQWIIIFWLGEESPYGKKLDTMSKNTSVIEKYVPKRR